jgi:hypothetical protein
MTLIRNTTMAVATNPVARAIERANLRRWHTATALQILSLADGAECSELLTGLAEAIAMGLKTTEGFDDPADVRGQMLAAMGHLVAMTNAGRTWQAQHAPALCDALDAAAQLLAAADPASKLTAWAWVVKAAQAA